MFLWNCMTFGNFIALGKSSKDAKGELWASWLECSETNALNTRYVRWLCVVTLVGDLCLASVDESIAHDGTLYSAERRKDSALFCKLQVQCLSALGSDKELCEAHNGGLIQTKTATSRRNIRKPENYR